MIRLTPIKNKRGDEYVDSFIFLIVAWPLVFLVIVLGTTLFFSADINSRQLESYSLVNKLLDCLIDEDMLNTQILNEGGDDLLEYCSLNKELIKESGDFYISIKVDNIIDNSQSFEEIKYGNYDFEIQCELNKNTKSKNLAFCEEKSTYFKDIEGKEYLIKIKVGSKNIGKE